MHYLDNAATTAVAPAVADVINDTLRSCYANPSSLYGPGVQAGALLRQSRAEVAAAMGFEGRLSAGCPEVIFTASGTEGSNIAVLGAARARKGWGNRLVATGYEHPAVAAPLALLAEREGFALTLVNPGADGHVDPDVILEAVDAKTVLVCAMQVNNETGAVLDVAALAEAVKRKNPRAAFHVDGVQGFCKLPPLPLQKTQIDSYAVSGHKIHAPKGVGALYLRRGFSFVPPLAGGGQEQGRRPGTENIPYIAGLARAATLAAAQRAAAAPLIQALHDKLVAGLSTIPGTVFNSPPNAYPGIVNVSLPAVRSETMLHHLEALGVYVSSGSACSGGAASHTLTAMGLPAARVDTALRISFGAASTEADIDALLAGVRQGLATLAHA